MLCTSALHYNVIYDRKCWKLNTGYETQCVDLAIYMSRPHDYSIGILLVVSFYMRKSLSCLQADLSRAHLCRESGGGAGLRADGDLTRRFWCPPGAGDSGVSGGNASAALPPSKNTSLAPTLTPAGPGDITKDGRTGLTTPGPRKLLEEPRLSPAAAVTCATVPRFWFAPDRDIAPASPSLSRGSSAAFRSAFPSLPRLWGRPSREMLLRKNRAACLRLESLDFLRCSRRVFVGLLPVLCRPQAAVAILLWNVSVECKRDEWPVSRLYLRPPLCWLALILIMHTKSRRKLEVIGRDAHYARMFSVLAADWWMEMLGGALETKEIFFVTCVFINWGDYHWLSPYHNLYDMTLSEF